MKRKFGFPLKVEDDWPPFDVEHIWVDDINGLYQVKSFPFFLKGMSYDDILSVKADMDGYVSEWEFVSKSLNSTIWIIEINSTDVAQDLSSLNCGIERETSHNLISVNVPPSVNLVKLDETLRRYEETGAITVAVPADRIGLLTL